MCALYFAQGLPFGFQAVALSVYLRSNGVSLTGVGFAGALALPWMLKALWAPFVDRYQGGRFGRRKPWIVTMQAGLALTCLAASVVPASSLAILLALVFLMNLFAATQDIAVDGLAIDLLKQDELGLANAGQVVGYKVGMLTGGGLLVWASRWIGWSGLFLAMSGLIFLVLLVVLSFREPEGADGSRDSGPDLKAILAALRSAMGVPGGRWLLLFVGTYKFGEAMIDMMFKPFLVDNHIPDWQIGLYVGTWGMAFSIVGSAAGGWLASTTTLWRALAITATLRVVPLIGVCWLALFGVTTEAVIVVTCAEHFFGGALTTAMFAFMMSRVDRRIGATHYTVLAAVEVIGKSPGIWAAGGLATWLGYAPLFIIGTVLSVAFLALLLPLRPDPAHAQPLDVP